MYDGGLWMFDKNESETEMESKNEVPMVKQIHVIVKYRLVVNVPYHSIP